MVVHHKNIHKAGHDIPLPAQQSIIQSVNDNIQFDDISTLDPEGYFRK